MGQSPPVYPCGEDGEAGFSGKAAGGRFQPIAYFVKCFLSTNLIAMCRRRRLLNHVAQSEMVIDHLRHDFDSDLVGVS